jgi:hypothetical protein
MTKNKKSFSLYLFSFLGTGLKVQGRAMTLSAACLRVWSDDG